MLQGVRLRVPDEKVSAVRAFYIDKLRLEECSPLCFRAVGNEESAMVQVIVSAATTEPGHSADALPTFWKIGLSLDDVNDFAATQALQTQGKQFLDVGFLTHVSDPAGLCVELLQTSFENNENRRNTLLAARPIVRPLSIGQITLRVTNVDLSLAFYRDRLGMRLLARIPVPQYSFTLYFLAYTSQEPPNPYDLEAVENREWCWTRPYTTLELQHFHSGREKVLFVPTAVPGFDSITVAVSPTSLETLRAEMAHQVASTEFHMVDPDGTRVNLISTSVLDPTSVRFDPHAPSLRDVV